MESSPVQESLTSHASKQFIDRVGSGWSGTAPAPLELNEESEIILNITAESRKLSDREAMVDEVAEWECEPTAVLQDGPWTYGLIEQAGTIGPFARVISYNGEGDEVAVPEELGGHPVREMGSRAFANDRKLHRVALPDSVRRIGRKVFSCDFDLRSVRFGDGITDIPTNVFENCRSLEEVRLPTTLVDLPDKLLWDALALRTLTVPRDTRSIGALACRFDRLESFTVSPDNPHFSTDGTCLFDHEGTTLIVSLVELKRYVIPEGTIAVGNDAFKNQRGLHTVEFPASLQVIGERALFHTDLDRVVLPEGLRVIEDQAFAQCASLCTVEFPSTLEVIGREAFAQTKLNRVRLPASLATIGESAFDGCPLRFTDENSFSIDANNKTLSMHQGAIYAERDGALTLLTLLADLRSLKVAPGTKVIADGACEGMANLSDVEFPESLQVIGSRAFARCKKLRKADLPAGLRVIGEDAFYETNVRTVQLGADVERLGPRALTVTGAQASLDLTPPRSITVDGNNERFYVSGPLLCERRADGDALIAAQESCGDVRIPDSVTRIESLALARTSIDALTVPPSVKHVDVRAFLNLMRLGSITVEWLDEDGTIATSTLQFPRSKLSLRWYATALRMGEDGVFFDHGAYDDRTVQEPDDLDFARLSLARLDNPVKLANEAKAAYESELARRLVDIMKAAVSQRAMDVIEKLADRGFIAADNIDYLIERSAAWRQAEGTAYLLEMKKQRYAFTPVDDFSY